MKWKRLTWLGPAFVALIYSPSGFVSAQETRQSTSTATLAETLDWIRSRIDKEQTEPPGIKIRESFTSDGCKVSFH
jgi:hypothetical protein